MKRRLRHKVVTRAKVRNRRLKTQAAVLAVLALGGLAAATMRHVALAAPSPERILASLSPRWDFRLCGVAPEEEGPLLALLSGAGSLHLKIASVRERYPFYSAVKARRSWLRRTLTLEFEKHAAVGLVAGGGYLSGAGVLFPAPKGLYADSLPVLEVSGADEAQLKALARFLAAAAADQALSSPLARMRFVSEQEGWKISCADGTQVLWGSLSWTDEKFMRLRQVLADARERTPAEKPRAPRAPAGAALVADMRYFEDGKILLRQAR